MDNNKIDQINQETLSGENKALETIKRKTGQDRVLMGEVRMKDKNGRNAVFVDLNKLPKIDGKTVTRIAFVKVKSKNNRVRVFGLI